jgi:CHAD domain-containing protein
MIPPPQHRNQKAMAYAFARTDSSVAAALRRIARSELDGALADLAGPGLPAPAAVHGTRKRLKKLRGLIRLVAPVFKAFATENAALRDAGQQLSGLRDAEVRIATFARLTAAEDALAPGDRAAFRATLEAAREAVAAGEDGSAAARATLAAIRDRVVGWQVAANGFAALAPGLERTWTRARKAQADAAAARARDGETGFAAEPFHEWRKRVKAHWYQARLLAPIWPEMMAPHVAAADDLGESLGLHNDADVLVVFLAATDAAQARPAAFAQVAALALAERRRIADAALVEGRRLFAGSGRALARRWGVWWSVWRGD